jgi:dihydropyrimidinase
MSVLIKGGRVVTAADDYVADIYVEGERISLIGESLDLQADRVVDASGKYVFPGCVDPHTHLDMPFGGTVTIDDVESGQTSAAAGGTTCHVDFVIQPKGATFAEALEDWRAKANGKQVIDMGYHMAVTDLKEGGSLEELAGLPDQGVTSYKLFMAYKGALMVDDETLFRTMEVAADTGALVMVHAENGDAIDVLVKKALAEGHTEPAWHARTRPPETEGEATNRAIQLARVAGCALYVVHVSCAEAVEPIQLAREKGWNVHGETCTQYFFVDETFLERPDFEGAKYVYTPPPRAKANQDVLWNAVRTDTLSAISTDHCAFNWDGQKTLGRDDFSKIPNGGPGLENRLHMIHEFGVRAGRISLNRMVELLCTNPAKLFGLYPRKGTIAVGSDADVVVFDPEKRHTISASTHHSKIDYNLYEGTEVTGSPELVLLRGNVLFENDEVVAQPGIGQYVARARFGEELRPLRAGAPA